MPTYHETVTLALNGDVPLEVFSNAVQHLHGLVGALAKEVAPDIAIEWLISDLQSESAIMTIRGEADEPGAVDRVVEGYESVARALEAGEPIPYSRGVGDRARSIVGLMNGHVTSVRFETPKAEWTVYSGATPKQQAPRRHLVAYGAIRGRIQTLSNRGGLRFYLYDTLEDKAVSCYLEQGQEELIRGAWGRRAIVAGWVSRDPVTGRPVSIRRVNRIEILADPVPGGYQEAIGVLPVPPGGPSAEEAIRRVRDA